MSFKLKPFYNTGDMNQPIYSTPEEPGVNGRTHMNGAITIDMNISDPDQLRNTISHERVHVKQIRNGQLSYTDTNIFWKGKAYPLQYSKNSPWEQEAYAKEIPLKKKK